MEKEMTLSEELACFMFGGTPEQFKKKMKDYVEEHAGEVIVLEDGFKIYVGGEKKNET